MRIFHAPMETITNQMGLLGKGLSELGHEVISYNVNPISTPSQLPIESITSSELKSVFNGTKEKFDVFHFNYGALPTDEKEDLTYIVNVKKVKLMSYSGYEIRPEGLAQRHNPYIRLLGSFASDESIRQKLELHANYFPACLVPDFEVAMYAAKYFDRVYVLPFTIDFAYIHPHFPVKTNMPFIIHEPDHLYKGTLYIEDALDQLREEGYAFHYESLQGKTVEEAAQLMNQADLVIEQILCGSYGMLAVEAMARGKPVMAYIREDLKHRYGPDLPIISANPGSVYRVLRSFLGNPDLFKRTGIASRAFAERNHALSVTARQLDWVYHREQKLLAAEHYDVLPDPAVIGFHGFGISASRIHPKTRHIDSAALGLGIL